MAFLIIGIILIVLLVLWCKFIKTPKLNSINFVSGSLGTGKTFFSVRLGLSKRLRVTFQNIRRKLVYYLISFKIVSYKKFLVNSNKYLDFIRRPDIYDKPKFNIFYTILIKIYLEEDIEIYCDIPLDLRIFKIKHFDLINSLIKKQKIYNKVDFALRIEKEHLLREKRFNYKSIVIFDEISIFIDQFDFDDKIINEKLNNFFKFFRHETKGGIMIINSQSINDCHHSLKNCLSQYFYIHHRKKLLFGILLYVQELVYSNDNNVVNVNQGDIEEGAKLKLIWVSKKYFKIYDTYAHSWLTDNCLKVNLPFDNNFCKKSRNLWSFKLMSSLFDNVPSDMLTDKQLEYIKISDLYKKSYMYRKYKELEKYRKECDSYDKENA